MILEDKNELLEAGDDSSSFSHDEGEAYIDGLSNYNIILEHPQLAFDGALVGGLRGEILDWFSEAEVKMVGTVANVGRQQNEKRSTNGLDNESSHTSLAAYVKTLNSDDPFNDASNLATLEALVSLCHFSLGQFATNDPFETEEALLDSMRTNAIHIVREEGLIEAVCHVICSRASILTNVTLPPPSSRSLKMVSMQLFYALTVLHMVLSTYNTESEASVTPLEGRGALIDALDKSSILIKLLCALESWESISASVEGKDPSSILETISAPNDPKNATEKFTFKFLAAFRMRNVVMVFNGLILVLFGNFTHLKSTSEFLHNRFDSNPNERDHIISSMDYEYYKNELVVRYPTFTPPTHSSSDIVKLAAYQSFQMDQEDGEIREGSSSSLGRAGSMVSTASMGPLTPSAPLISNILNLSALPFNQHQHLKNNNQINGMLVSNDPPDVHIATPMPSPTLTPQHTGSSRNYAVSELKHPSSEVKKKLYVTQANFPNVCPKDTEPPQSIKDAMEIFYSSVNDDFSTRQLFSSFEQFIQKEHGVLPAYNDSFQYTDDDIKDTPFFEPEINSLRRVEAFYKQGLPHLNALIKIIIQILTSSIIPTHISKEDESMAKNGTRQRQVNHGAQTKRHLNALSLSMFERQKLEINRMRESMLKSATSIIVLLQEWFKLSHVLKFEYFTSLLYDQDYPIYLFRYLDSTKIQALSINSNDTSEYERLLNNTLVYCDYEVLYQKPEYNVLLAIMNINNKSYNAAKPLDKEALIDHIFEKLHEDPDKPAPLSFILPFAPNKAEFLVKNPNINACIVISNLFKSMSNVISNCKLQRIYKLLDLRPGDIFRHFLTLHNKNFYEPILAIVKMVAPFMGKKWRTNNMDLISFVYLFDTVGMKDVWLNNVVNSSIDDRISKSSDNEFSLRCLIKFYNFENYGLGAGAQENIEQTEFFDQLDKFQGDFFLKGCLDLDDQKHC